MTAASDQLRDKLQSALVAAGMSTRELVRASGFMRHQIEGALNGHVAMSKYTYDALMKHIANYQAKEGTQ